MKQIETGLVNYYDPNNQSSYSTHEEVNINPNTTAPNYTEPIARIISVREGSPSDHAVYKIDLIMMTLCIKLFFILEFESGRFNNRIWFS